MMELTNDELRSRITFDRDILGGKPIIRGLRISVSTILDLLAKGASVEEILEDYPDLEKADIHAAVLTGNAPKNSDSQADFGARAVKLAGC